MIQNSREIRNYQYSMDLGGIEPPLRQCPDNFGGVCWKKLELSTKKTPMPTSEKLRSGGAGIPFPQTPFPSRPAFARFAGEPPIFTTYCLTVQSPNNPFK